MTDHDFAAIALGTFVAVLVTLGIAVNGWPF